MIKSLYIISLSIALLLFSGCGSDGKIISNPSTADTTTETTTEIETEITTKTMPFKIIIRTDNPGSSSNKQFTIPTNTDDWNYNYNVDCNSDGTDEAAGVSGNYTCNYESAGEYTISISEDFPQIYFNNEFDKEKLLHIERWGTQQWRSMENAFFGCSNMTLYATDNPDLSLVTDMSGMFHDAIAFNGDLSSWDVSSVTHMNGIFSSATAFNSDLSSWDVSSVIDMGWMFSNVIDFNSDLSSWDVSSVINMKSMFIGTKAFDSYLNSWDVSSVTHMNNMFFFATAFNGDLSSWDVSSVTDMSAMFLGSTSFDRDLSSWDVSSVTDMHSMFGTIALSTTNYDNLLISLSSQNVQSGVDFDGGNSKYSTGAAAAREKLITDNNWNINDGGQE